MKKAILQLHIAIFLAGFTAILGKLITLNEAMLVWWRLLLALLVLAAWFLCNPKKLFLQKKAVFQIMGVGTLIGLHWLCFFGSIKFSNVSIALVCFSSSGFFAALAEPFFTNKKWSLVHMGLGLLSLAGIIIIFSFDSRYQTGIVLGIVSAATGSIFSILNKKLIRKMDSLSMIFWEMAGALIILSLIVPFYAFYLQANFLPKNFDWLWILILSVLCTVWAFLLQLKALKHISAFTLNLSYNLEPVYGILLAFLIFKEGKELSGAFVWGATFICTAILIQMYLMVREHRKQQNPL